MRLTRRLLAVTGICLALDPSFAQTVEVQNIVRATAPLPKATIYVAREVVTLDPNRPSATAVAVVGDRILATGTVDELKAAAGEQAYIVDNTFADKVIVPGFIAQHDHPMLTALTMVSEIIAIEDWVLPFGTIPAAHDPEEYRRRLVEANAKLADPNALLFSWGYHHLFHGKLTRADLDKVSSARPIIIIHRSWHEAILNTRALETLGIGDAYIAAMPEAARKQVNLPDGHFWEGGLFAIAPKLMPVIASPERFRRGLELTEQYLHANGITLGSEPGGLYSKELQAAENAVMSDAASPFRFYFIPDGKSIYAAFRDATISETEKTLSWGQGMTSILPRQIKLFADGSVYSQLMQLRQPYLDGHRGEWIVPPVDFARAFQIYWDAGYQIHVHVTGDAGVDMVLDNLEANIRRHPRYDHRTVLIHFAVSQADQIARIQRLGAIVSGNPYYLTMLADKFSTAGLGPERADNMVRMGDVERAGIHFSYHSDMPMAPAQPLFLMHTAVNRTTVSGRVAGADQRSSREGALRAVTLEAAYSLRMENEVGSIASGKLANLTILSENPVTVPSARIKDIAVWGTVQEGRKLPVQRQNAAQGALGPVPSDATDAIVAYYSHAQEDETGGHSDICMLNRMFAAAMFPTK